MHDLSASQLDDLSSYVNGTLSPAEMTRVEHWIGEHPDRHAFIGVLARARLGRATDATDADLSKRVGEISKVLADRIARSHVGAHGEHASRSRAPRTGPTKAWWIGALMTAGVGAVLAIGIGTMHHPSSAVRPPVRYATRPAQRATVVLEDGSRIIMAPQTMLSIVQGRDGAREVSLTGQARFEIASSTAHVPFVVRTGRVTTRVLGTTFDVTRYDAGAAEVVVLTGRVGTGITRHVVVSAGERARVTDSTVTVTTISDPQSYAEWTRGRLHFDEAPIADVLTTVGRWYGLQFRLADSALARRHITATFYAQSATDAIRTLALLLDVTPRVQDTVVVLQRRAVVVPARRNALDALPPHPLLETGR